MTVFNMTMKRIYGNKLSLVFIMLFPIITFGILSATTGSIENDGRVPQIQFAVADNDNTAVSQALVNRLALRYQLTELEPGADYAEEITALLTEGNTHTPWALLIREGFEHEVLAGNVEGVSRHLESFTITPSDASAIGTLAAESITRALMILGTNNETALTAWHEAAALETLFVDIGHNWSGIAQWLSMFGFISILTAYFVVRTLVEDKFQGMPDRIGALPVSMRSFLLQGSLAAFVATQISVVLTIVALWITLGAIDNVVLLFVVMSFFNLFAVSFVITLTSMVKTLAGASAVMSMSATIMAMLGGLFWPLELVPVIMQRIAWFTPGYWFGEGLRTVGEISGTNELTFQNFWMPMLFLLGFTIVTLLIGGLKRVQKLELE
jgi:ABC-2 type transport system permease protein